MEKYLYSDSIQLYHGDALDVLKKIPTESVDSVVTDPPYFLSNGGKTFLNGKIVSVDKGEWDKSQGLKKDFDFHMTWLSECKRILKPDGTIFVSGTYHSIYVCGFILQILKYKILNEIIWFKKNIKPNFTKRNFTASHETLIWAAKDFNSKYFFNYDLMKEYTDDEDELKKKNFQMHTVWQMAGSKKEEKKFGIHPTQKPLAMYKRILLSSTQIGDVVLDPFSGSGTTGVAALETNRKFIGIEKNLEYFHLMKKRIIKNFENDKME